MFIELSRAAALLIAFKYIRHAKKKRARELLAQLLIDDC
jgi:hypothetical protein